MSFMKKLAELIKKQNTGDENRPDREGPSQDFITPDDILKPPDNRVMADQGIGGYLNPNQLEMFTNPPVPNNQAGLTDMARLLQQQQDTFGNMLTYTSPPSDDSDDTPPPGGGTGGGGTGGGGTGGGGTGGGGNREDREDRDRQDIIDEIRRMREQRQNPPPQVPPIGIPGIPINTPAIPPMVPGVDIPFNRDMLDYGYGPGIMPPLPPIDFDMIKPPQVPPTELPPTRRDLPPQVPLRELPPSRELIDYGFGPGIMPPLPDEFINPAPVAPVTPISLPMPPRRTGIDNIPVNNNVPVPRIPTGMETLVSPDIFINRNRRGMSR